MSKLYKIVHQAHQQQCSTFTEDTNVDKVTDWDKCVLCQEVTAEVLSPKSPASFTRSIDGAGYRTLADSLLAFEKINCLPPSIVSCLMKGQNLAETLKTNYARLHESCRLQYNRNKLERAKKRQAQSEESDDEPIHKKYTRHCSGIGDTETKQCFFCGKQATIAESLHCASTFGLDARVRDCALQLQDQHLLAKLSAGDLIALEAKCHSQCLVSLYNRARQSKGSDVPEDSSTINHGITLAVLVAYIEDAQADNECAPIFQLADLIKMYSTRVGQLETC